MPDPVDLNVPTGAVCERLTLKPGDVLLIQMPDNTPHEVIDGVFDRLREVISPDYPVLVVAESTKISVARREDIEYRP